MGKKQIMIKNILQYALINKCSDVIIAAQNPPRVRINGDLMVIPKAPVFDDAKTSEMIESLMTEQQKQVFFKELEIDFAIEIEDGIRFRVNVFKAINGTCAAFRIIKNEIRNLQELNAPKIIQDLLKLKQGLILVTGPTGCGKSTTLAAMVDHLNKNYKYNIITIEDPIEFVHSSQNSLILQREVGRNTLSFNGALKSALRENPDVILVGEMRNLETISLALSAAETGHLVLATLHTNSAAQSINRIIDVFDQGTKPIIRSMLSNSLNAIISQRLIKTAKNSRVAAFEALIANNSIRNLIRDDKIPQINTMMEIGKKYGMITLKDSITTLANQEIISQDEAKKAIAENFSN